MRDYTYTYGAFFDQSVQSLSLSLLYIEPISYFVTSLYLRKLSKCAFLVLNIDTFYYDSSQRSLLMHTASGFIRRHFCL